MSPQTPHQKPVLWILHPCTYQQMTFSEHLEENYNLIFFDSLSSMKTFAQVSDHTPQLLLADLIATHSDLNFLESFASKKLGIASDGIAPRVLENSAPLLDEMVFSPFSATQLKTLIEELLDSPVNTPKDSSFSLHIVKESRASHSSILSN